MKISDLKLNPQNPRKITDKKLEQLKNAMLEFGDLSGVIYNQTTKQLVGGHQRTKQFEAASTLTYTKEYKKPTKTGTVAEGFILMGGERFSYREVKWTKQREKAANLAANKNAGDWDKKMLSTWLKELSSFDVDFDISLTMFDEAEIAKFADVTVKEHTRTLGTLDDDINPPVCRDGQTYALGTSKLVCSELELHFCDEILKRWEKYSGEKPKLIVKPILKKAAEQSKSSYAQTSRSA